MPTPILMPALSPTMTEGTLAKWCKSEGDTVEAGDVIAEIETDKATMEVEAVDEGKLGKILVSEGSENVLVNTPIAILLEEGESESDIKESEFSPEKEQEKNHEDKIENKNQLNEEEEKEVPQTHIKNDEKRLFITPLAKRIASQEGIDASKIEGSGPHGRIVKSDVEKAMVSKDSFVDSIPANISKESVKENKPKSSEIITTEQAYEDVAVNGMRKIIAKRLTESKQEVPHFYLSVECRLDALLSLRKTINETLDGKKISVNDFVLKASALSLKDVPEANASWLGDKIRMYKSSDISVAVAIDGGLITPVVKNAESKTISTISDEVKDLALRAREGKLMPEEYQGGSFSVSNLGMFGIKSFQAIINPPQGCILSVGAGEKRAVVGSDGEITAATVMDTTLSVDHRVVDGAVGAKFLKSFKDYIENPMKLLI